MRRLLRNVECPLCGQDATLTLFEQIDGVPGSEGHRIGFACANRSHVLTEIGMARLWAADRVREVVGS